MRCYASVRKRVADTVDEMLASYPEYAVDAVLDRAKPPQYEKGILWTADQVLRDLYLYSFGSTRCPSPSSACRPI